MASDYSRKELAERRRMLNRRVAKLAVTLEDRRRTAELVASASRATTSDLASRYPALRDKERGGVRPSA